MKNLEVKEGYKNRHLDGLPDTVVYIKIIHSGNDGVILCKWYPVTNGQHSWGTVLGTARDSNGLGYHAWLENNDEFVYYSLVDLG